MASQTDICNQALILIGDDPIVSIDDKSKQARTLKAIYDMQRQAELRANRWKFSLTRSLLPAQTNNPAGSPFSYSYALPTSCLKVIDVNGIRQSLGSIDYRSGMEKLYDFQGNVLLTNFTAPITLHFVQDVTVTTQFDALFVVAFSALLAWKASYSLAQSATVTSQCEKFYRRRIVEAKMQDAIEKLPEGIADDSWVLSRL